MPDHIDARSAFVSRAMTDRAFYDEQALKESAIWDTRFSAFPENYLEQVLAEQQATAALKAHRGGLHFPSWAKERAMVFDRALVVGCGYGRLEQSWYQMKFIHSFHGIDISPGAIELARKAAEQNGLPFTYEVQDLNYAELEPNTFDLVICQTSIHHCLHLERIADQISQTLRPGGIVWLHDFIGESMLQFTDKRMELVNRIIDILPEKYRTNAFNGRPAPKLRRAPIPPVSPFESIRSADIPTAFVDRFNVLEKREIQGIWMYCAGHGTRAAFAASEEGRAMSELILLIEELAVQYGITPPVSGQYILQKRE